MANINRELNDIKHAVYGKDVRGSIHDGIDKVNKESETSKGKADEAYNVMNNIMQEGFDNAALESNFEQKLDDKIDQLQPEWTQFKDDTDRNFSDVEAQLADVEQLTQDYDLTVTVGGSIADFQSIGDALSYLSRKKMTYKKNGYKAEIKLLSGFVLGEQVFVDGIDLSYITITSEDDMVVISRQSMTEQFTLANADNDGAAELYPAFAAKNSASLPNFDVLFDMSTSGTSTNRHCFVIADNSSVFIHPKKGCINAGGVGLYAINGSRAVSYEGNYEGSGVACFRGSFLSIRRGNVSGAYNNIYLGSSSVVEALGADISNAGNRGIWVYGNGRINARDADIRNCGERAIYATQGSSVTCGNAKLSGSRVGILAEQASVVDAHGIEAYETENEAILVNYASTVNAEFCKIDGCGGLGAVTVQRASTCNLKSATVRDSAGHAVFANRGGNVNMDDAICTDNGQTDIRVARGSIISAHDASGSTSQTINQITSDGIIFK